MPPSSLRSTSSTSIVHLNSTSPTISSLTVGQPCIITTCHPQQWHRRSHLEPLPNRLLIIASCQNVSPSPYMSSLDKSIQRIPFPLAPQPPMHSFLRNCSFPLSALSVLFSLVPGDGAWVAHQLVRMFSTSCTAWVSVPRVLSVPTVPQNRSQSFFCLPLTEHSPRSCDPHHPFSFISTRSSTYHFPLRILHMFELLPPIPSNPESTH